MSVIEVVQNEGWNNTSLLLATSVESLAHFGKKDSSMNYKVSYVSVASALGILTPLELRAIVDNPNKLKEFAGDLVAHEMANTYVVHIDDKNVPEQYREATTKWRKYAASFGYTGPVVWKVREGFTLKKHAPLAGPCFHELEYLQNWGLKDDPTTKDSLVFWIPRLAEGSTNKTIDQMEKMRGELKGCYVLPDHHATSFGDIALLFALILTYFKRTGDRVPLEMFYAASDSFDRPESDIDSLNELESKRLYAGAFSENGLVCNRSDKKSCNKTGFFLIGVELL